MGAESGTTSTDGVSRDDILVISTEMVEQRAGKLQDSCTSLRNAAKSIESARTDLSSISQASSGCLSGKLQTLADAQNRFFRNVGMLEGGANALRNIAITYNNAEQALKNPPGNGANASGRMKMRVPAGTMLLLINPENLSSARVNQSMIPRRAPIRIRNPSHGL